MYDKDRVRRSNKILVVMVILLLLYGILYRVQSGDNKLYIFGHSVDLPFGTQQEAAEEVSAEE